MHVHAIYIYVVVFESACLYKVALPFFLAEYNMLNFMSI